MGLAVLPARLKDEMAALEQAILDGAEIREDEVLAKHADWVEEFLPKYGFTAGSGLEGEITPEKLHEIIQNRIGLVFKEVYWTQVFTSAQRKAEKRSRSS